MVAGANRGFTLVEILTSVLILVLISGILFASFRTFTTRRILDGAQTEVVATLTEARAQTLDSLSDSTYGVHVASDSLVIFKGTTYTAGDPDNRTVQLSSLVRLTASLSGGGSDIYFARITGKGSTSGTITVTLSSDASQTRTVTISQSGLSS